jgi:hypothetical protein
VFQDHYKLLKKDLYIYFTINRGIGGSKMLFATKTGRILSEEDINLLTPHEIETEGIHAVDTHDWDEWN